MSSKKSILADLDRMIQKVAEDKKATLKQASIGDKVEDGTSAPQTGAQLAKNKEEAGKGTAAKVDGGAKTNPAGASLEKSTEGATAVATDGQSGAKGGDLEVKHQAPNGPEGGIKGDQTKSAADLIAALEKAAGADEPTKTSATPAAVKAESETNGAVKLLKSALAGDRGLTPFQCFLVSTARAVPGLNKTAAAMDDGQLAGHVGDQLTQQIQSGAMSEEDAEKMLMEAVQSGALTEKDLMEAMQALHGQGAGGDAGAPPAADAGMGGAGAPPAPDAGAGAAIGPAGAQPGAPMPDPSADPAADAKLAALDIDEKHPLYLSKLASLYPEVEQAGFAFALKLANELAPPDDAGATKPEDHKSPEGAPGDGASLAAGMTDPMAAVTPHDDHEKQALLQLLKEMGMKPEDLQALMAAPAPAAPADPAQAKVAAFKTQARAAILSKAAALQDAAPAAK